MFEALFGAEMPLAVRFFLAFLVVLGLIGATAWAVRRFGAGRLGGAGLRGRQPRLAVIDFASVDARRRLILVRRDNVEHLLMIGGPTDVVVESNIVRAVAATRDVPAARPPAAAEALPRAVSLAESTGNGSWPLQPELAGPPRLPPRLEPEESANWPQQHAEPAPRPPRDSLAALADEIATRPVPPRGRAASPAPRLRPIDPRAEPRSDPRPEPRAAPRPEPRMPSLQPAEAESATSAADQSLADMAQRLEAALRKPKQATDSRDRRPPAAAPRGASAPEQTSEPEAISPPPLPPVAPPLPTSAPASPSPAAARTAESKPARTDAKAQGKALYDTLEQEMASLLGRPASKT